MSNEFIFYTQIGSIIAFIIALFFLYSLLVKQKDATIELLKNRINFLEDKNKELENSSPDLLTERLNIRLDGYKKEMKLLSKEDESKKEIIKEKENEISEVISKLDNYQEQLEKAKELMGEFFCPYCESIMSTREYHMELVEYNGRDCDIDHECTSYECGLQIVDGKEVSPCRFVRNTINK